MVVGFCSYPLKLNLGTIKTPTIYQHLNLLPSPQTSVPASLLLDLRPRGAEDLYRVHARCLQNPHALVRAAAQQKLSRVIEHLGRTADMKPMLMMF